MPAGLVAHNAEQRHGRCGLDNNQAHKYQVAQMECASKTRSSTHRCIVNDMRKVWRRIAGAWNKRVDQRITKAGLAFTLAV